LPQWHGGISKKKNTGGKKKPYRSKRSFELGRRPAEPTVGEQILRRRRSLGGNSKVAVLKTDKINVTDPKTNTVQHVDIDEVLTNPANVDYNRRGVITKGAIVRTPLGDVKVTSRPGQSGVVNGILLE